MPFDAEFNSTRLTDAITSFRKFTGRQLSDYCMKYVPPCFHAALEEDIRTDRQRQFWQPSRHPIALITEEFAVQKRDYLHDNPRRKGLVRRAEHWRYSSADWFLSDGKAACDVRLSRIEW